jgi:hypothetical protein
MNRNNVKLLVERYRSHTTDIIQNSSINVIEAHVHRDGLRAVDSGEFLIPTGVPVSEGDIVKWIQDDADVTHLRSCYLFQGSLRDEGGWEADGENTYFDTLPQTADWSNIGASGITESAPAGADKFKGLLRINNNAARRYSSIPNKLMYVNKTVSGGTTTANVHDFDGDFEIDMWITAPSSFSGTTTLFAKLGANDNITGKRIRIYMGSSGQIQAEVEDGRSHEVTLTTGSKICKVSAANFIRFQRKGDKYKLWLINGSEISDTLFTTPDATDTDSTIEGITSDRVTYIGNYEGGSEVFMGLIHSVRIYCGGVLNLGDARSLYKARATPLVMKLAGSVWKIKDLTKGKKLYVTGFGKVIPESIIDTHILDAGTEDSARLEGSGNLDRTLNVYKEENAQNIIFSLLKMLNNANTSDATASSPPLPTAFNKLIVGSALSGSDDIEEFVAEGNLLSIIKILLTRAAASNLTYSFFISPRGVCVLEDLGVDRGITFNHDPYNIQVSGGDDTFTVNDLTVFGRIPTITSKLSLANQTTGSDIDISALLGKSIPISVSIFDIYDSGVDGIFVGDGGTIVGAPEISLSNTRQTGATSSAADASISDYDGSGIHTVEVDDRGHNYLSAPIVTLSNAGASGQTEPSLTATISGGTFLENDPRNQTGFTNGKGVFTVNRENKTVNIERWNNGLTSGSHGVIIHVEHEDIITEGTAPNLKQFSDATSISNIGRYRKRIFVPQLTSGIDMLIFGNNLLNLSKDINKRYTIKAPFLVNFVRENHKVNVKNTLKNINATGIVIKSIHWHYPKGETIIEVGEHEANAYDLIVSQNETTNSLTAQSLKSMNR